MSRAARPGRHGRRILAALVGGRELDVSQICVVVNQWPNPTARRLGRLESAGWIAGRAPTTAEMTRPQFGAASAATPYYTITETGRAIVASTRDRIARRIARRG